jgi:cysteine-rich repeat protein
MRTDHRLGRRAFTLAMAIAVGLLAPRRASADVITIDDGGLPGTTTGIPFTCSRSTDGEIWRPYMGFVYRNVEAFELARGDKIAFDIQLPPGGSIGFRPQLDIALAHAPEPLAPFVLPVGAFTDVANDAMASGAGNEAVRDYDLAYTVENPFSFPGGVLIIRVSDPMGQLLVETNCLPVVTADKQPTGTNRLVGTFKLDNNGEYPWNPTEVTGMDADVPYVQIRWGCGNGVVSGVEQCDDGNTDNTDDCTNTCLAPACGDGFVQRVEECDNSADPSKPDPFCDDTCHVAAFAKGSGCNAGGGAGLVAMLASLALVLRRRPSRRPCS